MRAGEAVERALDAHGVSIKCGRYAGILTEQLEEMRPRQAGIASDIVEFNVFADAIIQNAQRFADAEIDRRLRTGNDTWPPARLPGLIKTRIEQLIQITVDQAIAGIRDQR